MRNELSIAAFLLVSLAIVAPTPISSQTAKIDLTFDDGGCGSPFMESQTYSLRQGKVWAIKSANVLVLRSTSENGRPASGTFEIQLVGISPSINSDQIRKFLKKHVLGKKISVFGNLPHPRARSYGATVLVADQTRDRDDIGYLNQYLIENGIAVYSPFESGYLVPYYWPCRLDKAQALAKQNGIGIWNKKQSQ